MPHHEADRNSEAELRCEALKFKFRVNKTDSVAEGEHGEPWHLMQVALSHIKTRDLSKKRVHIRVVQAAAWKHTLGHEHAPYQLPCCLLVTRVP